MEASRQKSPGSNSPRRNIALQFSKSSRTFRSPICLTGRRRTSRARSSTVITVIVRFSFSAKDFLRSASIDFPSAESFPWDVWNAGPTTTACWQIRLYALQQPQCQRSLRRSFCRPAQCSLPPSSPPLRDSAALSRKISSRDPIRFPTFADWPSNPRLRNALQTEASKLSRLFLDSMSSLATESALCLPDSLAK